MSSQKKVTIKRKHKQSNKKDICAVLLASYNGEEFIAEQLKFIHMQDIPDVKIFISDDGSVDKTRQVIEEQVALWSNDSIHVRLGPQKGYASNFMSILSAPDIEADYFAFADQDDIWERDKLSRAIAQLKKIAPDIPALYGSRSRLIDSKGKEIGFSPLFKKKLSFQNALVQCFAGGNTMVMNKAARNLLMQTATASVFAHDWWAYLLITGAGGHVFYDPHPTIRYRQHVNNTLGRNNNWTGRKYRIRLLFQGGFREWNTLNSAGLKQYCYLLTPKNQQVMDIFFTSRNKGLRARLFGLWKSGVYRQTFMGNVGLFVAALFKKL